MDRLGRYEIIEKIGEGGMGTVYKAKQPTLNKIVALKVLADFCAKDRELVERFMREAQIMANLPEYSHVVQVFDLDEMDGKYFYTMEYIPLSLAEYIGDCEINTDRTRKVKRESKVILVETALTITRHILKGLSIIHKAGIIHRDISPQNILLIKHGQDITAKITDFGIAGARDSGLTRTGMGGMGKEIYVAPEQWESLSRADERSDIYSLGIVMYRMVTGRLPVGMRIKEPSDLNPKVREALNDVILTATEQMPEDRFQSAQEMQEELNRISGAKHDVRTQTKASALSSQWAVKGKKPKYHLRSEPLAVSGEEFKEVFRLDMDRRPLEYVENEFEDNGDGTVTDHATGLMWQKSGSDKHLTYGVAQFYIRELNSQQFAGHNDWWLPMVPELMSLLEPEVQSNGLYIDPLFDDKQRWCWTSDERSFDSAWHVSFSSGLVSWSALAGDSYVRAVRSC